jgi:hypothetical protein
MKLFAVTDIMNTLSKSPPRANPVLTSRIFRASFDDPIQPHRTYANMNVRIHIRREPVQPRFTLPVPHRSRPSSWAADPWCEAPRGAPRRLALPTTLTHGLGGGLPDVLRVGLDFVRHGEGHVEVLDPHLERTCAIGGGRRSLKRGAMNPKIL